MTYSLVTQKSNGDSGELRTTTSGVSSPTGGCSSSSVSVLQEEDVLFRACTNCSAVRDRALPTVSEGW